VIPFQTLKTSSGEELVVISRAEFDRLCALAAEAEEDAADIVAYDAAKAEFEASGSIAFPPDLSTLLLKHKSRLAAMRKWRGLSQADLAAKVGIGQSFLSGLETGRHIGSSTTIEGLAAALDVPVDWIA
jgi:ribosome-binding protein aMBF1 (putative translation factor)